MKAAPFEYASAASVDEVVSLLAAWGPAAAVLAGGQSLLVELAERRRRPAMVVDINRAAGLAGLELSEAGLRVGALVRHAAFERPPVAGPLGRLLGEVAHYVGHPPVRARGTFVGSLAWGHPGAEWCAVALAVGGHVVLRGPGTERTVPIDEWFRGPFRTARRPDELITEVRLRRVGRRSGVGFFEHRRGYGAYCIAAAAAVLDFGDGSVTQARIGLANASDVPMRVPSAEAVLVGAPLSDAALHEAARRAAAESAPVDEPSCSAEYRRQVIGVTVLRALDQAWEMESVP